MQFDKLLSRTKKCICPSAHPEDPLRYTQLSTQLEKVASVRDKSFVYKTYSSLYKRYRDANAEVTSLEPGEYSLWQTVKSVVGL